MSRGSWRTPARRKDGTRPPSSPNYPDKRAYSRDFPAGLVRLALVLVLVGWLAYIAGIVALVLTGHDPKVLSGPVTEAPGGGLTPGLGEMLLLILGLVLKRQQDRTEALAGSVGPTVVREKVEGVSDEVTALRAELRAAVVEVLAASTGPRPAAARRRLDTASTGAVDESVFREQAPGFPPAMPPPLPPEEALPVYLTADPPSPEAVPLPAPLAERAMTATWDEVIYGRPDPEAEALERAAAERMSATLARLRAHRPAVAGPDLPQHPDG